MKTFKIGGIHPNDIKISKDIPVEFAGIPEKVFIPLSQHIGAPAVPIVNKGDRVEVGDLLAKGEAFVSANIHSSVSGVVDKIDFCPDVMGFQTPCVVINVEGDQWNKSIDRSDTLLKDITLSPSEIKAKIKELGIVGLGGAAFPTQVKISIPEGKKADYLLINAVECEPYLTADHRILLEKPDELLMGTKILMHVLDVKTAVIGIEVNKPDAIDIISKKAKEYDGISVAPLKVKYPQGSEKQLICAITGRQVPSGKLPIDIGCVVNNSGSTFATYEAIQKNKPLFERIVTVTGKNVKKPANFLVRIGTPISYLIDKVDVDINSIGKVISGGPMMGKAVPNINAPVVKGTSGILLMDSSESYRSKTINCIRCGKCIYACPMGLEPYFLSNSSEYGMFDEAEKHNITDCFECGACQYVCPSNRPLLDNIRVGKRKVIQIVKSRSSK
ncbi:MAG: electron transport complex subunit RsxC [Bacteroidales bacterium]